MNYHQCFHSTLRRQGKSQATIKNYLRAFREFISFCRGKAARCRVICNLRPDRLEAYRDYLLQQRQLRPSTVNGRLTGMSAFARFLRGRGLLEYNPLELVARVGNNADYKERPLASREDIEHLRREVDRDVLELPGRPIIELLCAGLSVRELCSLVWQGEKTINNLRVGSLRVELHEEARRALEQYLVLRPVLRGIYLIVGDGPDGALLPRQVYSTVTRLARKCHVHVTTRDLRLRRFAPALREAAPPAAA